MIPQTEILKTVLENISFTSDPSKIIITLDDLKYIPELSKIISFEKIVQSGNVTLSDFHDEDKEKIIFIFLKKYNFIQKFEKRWYFDYTKMLEFWPNLSYYNQIFENKDPDYVITTNDKTYEFYAWDNIELPDKLYIGYMFFSAFNKIKEMESVNEKEYEYFTDIEFKSDNLNMIENFEIFFLKEFATFINTSNGDVFCDYSFGSNLKLYIQSKNNIFLFEKIKTDIAGFINDISILYKNAIELADFSISMVDDYSLKINLLVKINQQFVKYEVIKTL